MKLGQIFSGDEEVRCDSGLFSVVLFDCPRGSCQLSAVKLDGFALSALYLLLSCSECVFVGAPGCVFVCVGMKVGTGARMPEPMAVHSRPLLPDQGVTMCSCNRSFCCGETWWFVTDRFHALLVIYFPGNGVSLFGQLLWVSKQAGSAQPVFVPSPQQ